MRDLLADVFEPNRYNIGTLAFVAAVLLFAYVVYPRQIVQYAAWLVVFTVWMAWFIYVGVDRVYGIDT